MGRRPRFCPPLLSNRCTGTVPKSSSPPRASHASSYMPASSSSPSFRTMQGQLTCQERGQRTKKRKSPHTTIPLLRSPLSRTLLSSRMRSTSPRMRSPSVHLGASPLTSTTNRSYPSLTANSEEQVDIDLTTVLEEEVDSDLTANPEEQVDIDLTADLEEEVDIDLTANPEELVLAEIDQNEDLGNAQHVDGSEDVVHAQGNACPKRKEVPDNIRKAIVEALLARSSKTFYLKGHETREVSEAFSVPIRTVQRLWDSAKKCLEQGLPIDVSSKKRMRGRKKLEINASTLEDVPIAERATLDQVADHFGVSKSKVQAMKRDGTIKRVSNAIKPYLTEQNKKDRLRWCLSMLDPRTIPSEPLFKGMFDYVFIDEKWFNITTKTARYYSVPGEEQPHRTCKSITHIPRLMILAAVARPRYDSQSNCTFDGKIGCFPFITYEAAKRSSVNRPAGTIEMKPMDSIKKEVIRDFMIQKVLPAIRAKWPREDVDKPIFIQQDNARPHISPTDKLFCDAAKQDGFDIRLVCQPANSPDLNILDLGFFNSLQSTQLKILCRTIQDLVTAVEKAFQDYEVEKANKIFLTLQACMKEVMKIKGGNKYDTPHIRKEMLQRQGRLPLQLGCEVALVHEVMAQLNE